MWYLHKVIYYEEIKKHITLIYAKWNRIVQYNVEQKTQTQNNGQARFSLCKIKKVILICNLESHGIGYNFPSPFWEEN